MVQGSQGSQGLGFQGLKFGAWGAGFRVKGLGFRVKLQGPVLSLLCG
jgi:hypothetical protein